MDIKTFSEETTLHGVKNVFGGGSSSTVKRLLWGVIVVCLLVCFIVTVITSLMQYYRFESVMSSQSKYNNSLAFPAITVCNINSLRKSFLEENFPDVKGILQTSIIGYSDSEVDFEKAHGSLINTTMYDLFVKGGHLANDMFVECYIYPNQYVNCSNYIEMVVTDKSVCYTFNSKNAANDILFASDAGVSYGITLTFDVQPWEYSTPSGLSSGMRIAIHDQNVYPRMEEKGFMIAPGQSAYVPLIKEITKVLPKPYSRQDCVDQESYSEELCLFQCILKYWEAGSCSFYPSKIKPCTLYDMLVNVTFFHFKYSEQCNCLPKCVQTNFRYQISTAAIPNIITPFYSKHRKWKYNTTEDIKKNYCQIQVYYESLKYTVIEHFPATGVTQILTNFGGQMGLFLGASISTLIEILDFLLSKGFSTCYKNGRGKGKTVNAYPKY